MSFAKRYGHLTVGDAIKLNNRKGAQVRKRVDWDKVLICGVSLGFMASVIYLLMTIVLVVSK